MVNSNRDLVLVRNLRWLNKEKYSFSVHFIHFFPSALFLFSKNRIRSASGGLEMLIWSEASNQGDIYENEGTWRPCMRGRRRKGRGRGEWVKLQSPSLYPFISSSLPPTPFDTCYEGQRGAQTWKHPQSPLPYLFIRDARLVLSESLKEMFSLSLCNQTCSFHYYQPLLWH